MSLARENGTGEVQIFIGVSQILVLVAFMFSFVLAMTAAFLGAPAIAADVESGVAHAMLARPIRRADLVVGRWLGLSVVVVAYAAVVGPARDRRGPPRERATRRRTRSRPSPTWRPRRSS